MTIQLRNEEFVLDPSGAMVHPASSSIFIADLHLGKISHFRRHGFAVPAAAKDANLRKLSAVIDHYQSETLIFLGDLFHSSYNAEWQAFIEWRRSRNLAVILVEGNHDILNVKNYEDADIEVVSSIEADEIRFCHEPEEDPQKLTVCGHVHPGVRLFARGDQQEVLPCFYETDSLFVLPAFGLFTGKYLLKPTEAKNVYLVAGNRVLHLEGDQS